MNKIDTGMPFKRISAPNLKNLKRAVFLYIIMLILVSISGLFSDNERGTAELALKYFTENEINTGRDYFIQRHISDSIYRLISIIFLLSAAVKGYHSRIIERLCLKKIPGAIIAILSFASILLSLTLLRLPFAWFSSYYTGKTFGLMNADMTTWITRHLASSGIYILSAALSLSIISLIIIKTKRYLLYIPAAVFIISLLFTVIYPEIITPLFYRMEKLQEGPLKEQIHAMLDRAAIDFDGIYTIDSGRISGSVNAYMTGFTGNRRVILYDTLLKNYGSDEILSVIAHELCHYTEEHVMIGIALFASALFFVIPLIDFLSKFFMDCGIKSLVRPENHLLFIIIIIILLFTARPVQNSISRYIEWRADNFSLNLTGNPGAIINMKKKMAVQNKTHVLPNKIYVWFNYTHPPVLERIRNAEEY